MEELCILTHVSLQRTDNNSGQARVLVAEAVRATGTIVCGYNGDVVVVLGQIATSYNCWLQLNKTCNDEMCT